MPYKSRLQSLMNNADRCSTGNKQAGSVYGSDYARVSKNILKSKTSKPYLFSATSGNLKGCCSSGGSGSHQSGGSGNHQSGGSGNN